MNKPCNYLDLSRSGWLEPAKTELDSIEGLIEELDSIKAENKQLREWLSWGKYSAK